MNNYRYERKFNLFPFTVTDLLPLLKTSSLNFKEAYEERRVNSIYFDTFDLKTFFENIEGSAQRKKYRIRWYGDDLENIKSPKLEVKFKQSLAGYKETYELTDFNLREALHSPINFKNLWESAELPYDLKIQLMSLDPQVLTSYNRKYFQSGVEKIRITIDTDMFFAKLSRRELRQCDLKSTPDTIMEIKYPMDVENLVYSFLNKLPLRLTRYSKYVSAIDKIGL